LHHAARERGLRVFLERDYPLRRRISIKTGLKRVVSYQNDVNMSTEKKLPPRKTKGVTMRYVTSRSF